MARARLRKCAAKTARVAAVSDILVLPATARLRPPSLGTLASACVHLGLAAALLWVSPLRPLLVPPPPPVAVEIVTEQQFASMTAPAPPAVKAEAPAPAEIATGSPPAATPLPSAAPPEAAPKVDRGVVTATQFYAANILKEPGMARIRAALGRIDPAERIVQLCNIEGLEQIRRAAPSFDPDTLVAYAMDDTTMAGMTLGAAGGAFRSRREWYGIAFHCTVTADYSGVSAFSFKLGTAIPKDESEDHNLNAEDADE
jgi:Domain of Unknown Function (DUF930)